MKKLNSRRDFMKFLTSGLGYGLMASPLQILAQSVMSASAFGATSNKRYLYIQQPGAPSRWMYDLFLTPYSSAGFVQNPMVATRYTESAGRYVSMEYATTSLHGMQVPVLWGSNVAKSSGGYRPMGDLLQNLFALQGMTTQNAGHDESRKFHFRAPGSIQTNGGMAADASTNPVPCLNVNAVDFNFQSLQGKLPVSLNGVQGNLIEKLMEPFVNKAPAAYAAKKESIRALLDKSTVQLDVQGRKRNPLAAQLEESSKGAQAIMADSVSDFSSVWNQSLAKYTDLIKRSIARTNVIAGINDRPIGITGTRGAGYSFVRFSNIVTTPDLRDLITDTTAIMLMAEHFAVAEFVLLKDLSRSIVISPREFTALNTSGNQDATGNFDEHESGRMPMLYLNSMYYAALSACLLELIDLLKSKNIFNDTVIQVGGEFNRSPLVTSVGSDHGWQGSSVAIYSGSIASPFALGNIKNDPAPAYRGTWGYGGVIEETGKQLDISHLGATLAALLQVPSPVKASSSVVKYEGGLVVPVIGKTKIV